MQDGSVNGSFDGGRDADSCQVQGEVEMSSTADRAMRSLVPASHKHTASYSVILAMAETG